LNNTSARPAPQHFGVRSIFEFAPDFSCGVIAANTKPLNAGVSPSGTPAHFYSIGEPQIRRSQFLIARQ
jgi:hypothetical protein